MIVITVRFVVRPEHREAWLPAVDSFTRAARAEPGTLWFDWSRSVENPDEFVLLEAFRDGAAGEQHVKPEHFQQAMQVMPRYLAATPRILNSEMPGEDWSLMDELTVG